MAVDTAPKPKEISDGVSAKRRKTDDQDNARGPLIDRDADGSSNARIDAVRGTAVARAAITDSSDQGPNAVVVVDLDTGTSWRRLHDHPSTKAEVNFIPMVEGQPLQVRPAGGSAKPLAMGADRIAIDAQGERLYYCPPASRRLFSADIDALANRAISDDLVAGTVVDEGEKGASNGLESDGAGRIYFSDYEHNRIGCRLPEGRFDTVVQDPLMIWPDTLAVGHDGYLSFTAYQFNRQARYPEDVDQRVPPYYLFRTRIDAQPVALR